MTKKWPSTVDYFLEYKKKGLSSSEMVSALHTHFGDKLNNTSWFNSELRAAFLEGAIDHSQFQFLQYAFFPEVTDNTVYEDINSYIEDLAKVSSKTGLTLGHRPFREAQDEDVQLLTSDQADENELDATRISDILISKALSDPERKPMSAKHLPKQKKQSGADLLANHSEEYVLKYKPVPSSFYRHTKALRRVLRFERSERFQNTRDFIGAIKSPVKLKRSISITLILLVVSVLSFIFITLE